MRDKWQSFLENLAWMAPVLITGFLVIGVIVGVFSLGRACGTSS